MQSELKPCPFCGGDEQSFGLEVRWPNDIGHVECHGCNALITGETEAEAIAAWNALASDAEITRLTEALRAAEEREKALQFIGKWVERGVFDDQISADEALEVIINLPGMPWNSDRWDVDHKPYAAAYYARFPQPSQEPSHD